MEQHLHPGGQNRSDPQHNNNTFMLKWVQDNPGYQKKHCPLFHQIEGCSTPDALNNASQRADLLEQKQSISNLESSQITTSVAKASWLQGMFYLFFKIIRHEMRDKAFVFRFIRSLQNLIPKHKCL